MFRSIYLAGMTSAALLLAAASAAQAQAPAVGNNDVPTIDGINEPIDRVDPADPFGDIFGDMAVEEMDPTDQSLGADLTDVEMAELRVRCAEITEPDSQEDYPAQAIGVCTALADQLKPPTEAVGEVEMQDVSTEDGSDAAEQPAGQSGTMQ